jgi:hypothetical protein
MVQLSVIDAQLTKLGIKKTFFSKPEIKELQHILMDGEDIVKCVAGRYHGGFALLVATERRLLLIDKKPLYLTVEDIRYDMISEVDMNTRLFDSSISLYTVNKQLLFNSTSQHRLRDLTTYVQQRVMELRQYHESTPAPTDATQAGFVQPLPQISDTAHHLVSQVHVPEPVASAVSRTRESLPEHLQQAVGATATQMASRIQHNPNPYTKGPLIVHQRSSSW